MLSCRSLQLLPAATTPAWPRSRLPLRKRRRSLLDSAGGRADFDRLKRLGSPEKTWELARWAKPTGLASGRPDDRLRVPTFGLSLAGAALRAFAHPTNQSQAPVNQPVSDTRATSCSGFAGVIATDSPHPQAEVWFGLLKTNPDENLSTR